MPSPIHQAAKYGERHVWRAASVLRLLMLTGLLVLAGFSAGLSAEEKKECATGECHPNLQAKSPPSAKGKGHQDCRHCHQAVDQGKEHPLAGDKSFSLAKDVCQECHAVVVDFPHLHPPVAAGDCLVCHTLHSDTNSLLIPHPDHILCYDCHQPVTKAGDSEFHGEIAQQQCKSCHNAHGSFFNHLLTAPYSSDFFNDFDEKQYQFCFQCHRVDLLLHENTSYNTNFRDGQRNLHFVHVNRKARGRSCKLCHVVHGGELPKLMAKQVSFGEWDMPVNFVISPNGGQCTPGCHAPATYDRTRPAPLSLRPKPADDEPTPLPNKFRPQGEQGKKDN